MIKIVTLNIGGLTNLTYKGKSENTGLFKTRVTGALFLTKTGFKGDAQADLIHHGGADKAVCVYPYEHYAYWGKVFEQALTDAAFGENLTVQGMLETDIHIGDIFQIGEAIVQVTQPRQPCYKLIGRYGVNTLPVQMQEKGYTGFYLRVLQEGMVQPDADVQLIKRNENQVTIDFANQIMHHDRNNQKAIEHILSVEALSDSWRKTFTKRLEGKDTDTSERLQGKV